jgi:hypothetical protein
MRKTTLIVLSTLVAILFIGCNGSRTASATCKYIQGQPYPEKGAFRYEGIFDVHGGEYEVVLIVDGTEADRVALGIGEKQHFTLKCMGLTSSQHSFELRTENDKEPHKVLNGVVVIK